MKRIVFVMLSTLLLITSTSTYSIRAEETDSFEIPAINTGIIDLDKDQNIIIKTDEGVWTILLSDNLNDGKNSQETWQLGDYDKNVTASYQKGTQYITLSACFSGNISSVKSTMTSIHDEQCVCCEKCYSHYVLFKNILHAECIHALAPPFAVAATFLIFFFLAPFLLICMITSKRTATIRTIPLTTF